jgi:hypothetical protein
MMKNQRRATWVNPPTLLPSQERKSEERGLVAACASLQTASSIEYGTPMTRHF